MFLIECINSFDFSHEGFFKDPDDSRHTNIGHMSNTDACACACADDATCVAFTFQTNHDCFLYSTLSEKNSDSNTKAYIKKRYGKSMSTDNLHN